MAKRNTRLKIRQTPADLFDSLDLAVSSSSNVDELNAAYRVFTNLSAEMQRDVLVHAGPARTIAIALRGYEMPSLESRVVSSAFLTNVVARIDDHKTPQALREQVWLMLAQQRSVLLEQLEADLESLGTGSTHAEWHITLTGTYETIRTHAKRAIRHLFSAPLAQPELPIATWTAW